MIKQLVTDEKFLSQPAEVATADDADVATDLIDTIASLDDCACLAANQIGSTKAVIAYEVDGKTTVMFNPKLTAKMMPFKVAEGCLSLGRETEVQRFRMIRVSFDELVDGKLVSRTRKLTEWAAEIVQHAIDHCAGKLV